MKVVIAIACLVLQVAARKARTCQELFYRNSSLPDGEYTIQCAPNGKFKVYCHKMPDGVMQEFLTLPATGTKSKIFGNRFPVNSASYKCGQNCKESNPDDSTLTTVYSKIRINPCSFMVDVTDTTFAKTTGQIHDLGHHDWEKLTEPFAVAESCESGQDPGFANIDLTGTNFVLNSTFATAGAMPSGSTKFFGNQRAVVQADGYCGMRSPTGWSPYPASSRKPGHPQYVLQLRLQTPSPPTPNRNLCKVQGCGTYDPSRDSCHCDDNCQAYGNCCSDYSKVCKAPTPTNKNSCAVQGCGTYDPSRDSCHCDDNCEDYDNCCSDYEKTCKTPPTRNSCKAQGCGTYDPSRDSCHCDDNCEDYDNCCSDYEKTCKKPPTRNSCRAQGCGTYDPSRDSCHCDDNCEAYGNCCSDYATVCRNKKSSFSFGFNLRIAK